MPDLEMDYQASVAQDYELRQRPKGDAPSVRSVGKSKLIRPTRNAMDFAVRLLLRTPLPEIPRERRVVAKFGDLEVKEPRKKYPEPDEIAALEQNVLAIARRIGLLQSDLNPDAPESGWESMWDWFFLAQDIQIVFSGRYPGGLPIRWEHLVGRLSVYLSFKSGRPSAMTVRPACTRDALHYHAAQMIASGTRTQSCKRCKGPLLIGGPRARGKKKEGARFCSEQCRWDYNNARRKKG
jgi:hypothetical protein